MTKLEEIRADLAAEHDALEGVLVRLADPQWDLPTHAPGWLVRDQISHLARFDETATLAITDPVAFRAHAAGLLAGSAATEHERLYLARGRAMTPAELLGWWRAASAAFVAASRSLDPAARLPWYGPSMSAASFLTARLMETWSHGLDVVDVVGLPRPDTDRCGTWCSSGCGHASSPTRTAASGRMRLLSRSSSPGRRGRSGATAIPGR